MHEIFRFVIVSYSYDNDADADSNCHYFAGNQMGMLTQLGQFTTVVIPAALLAVDTFFLLR